MDDTAEVKLKSLRYCPSSAHSDLAASIYVKCQTSSAAAIHLSVDETFDIDMVLDNQTCAIIDFKIEPHGDMGKLVAANTDFPDRIRAAAARSIESICQPPARQ